MSVQSEINRINGNVADTYSVLSDMGATMPAAQNSDNLAATAAGVPAVVSMTYNSSTNKWTLTHANGTTSTVDGPAIPDVSSYMPKSGGTFTGAVYAMSGTGTDAQIRNTALVPTETYPTVNGQINWQYE